MTKVNRWGRFQAWRSKLAARVVETQAGRLFDPVLLPDPVPTDVFAFYNIVYTFFRIYLSLPREQQDKFRDLAEELRKIIDED